MTCCRWWWCCCNFSSCIRRAREEKTRVSFPSVFLKFQGKDATKTLLLDLNLDRNFWWRRQSCSPGVDFFFHWETGDQMKIRLRSWPKLDRKQLASSLDESCLSWFLLESPVISWILFLYWIWLELKSFWRWWEINPSSWDEEWRRTGEGLKQNQTDETAQKKNKRESKE